MAEQETKEQKALSQALTQISGQMISSVSLSGIKGLDTEKRNQEIFLELIIANHLDLKFTNKFTPQQKDLKKLLAYKSAPVIKKLYELIQENATGLQDVTDGNVHTPRQLD